MGEREGEEGWAERLSGSLESARVVAAIVPKEVKA